MKKAFLSLFLLISITSYSQTWSPPGANWKYTYFNGNSTGYVEIKYINDTLINGQNVKILEKSRSVSVGGIPPIISYIFGYEYTYENNGVVYMLNNVNSWDTLYNFNASIGDAWRMVKQVHPPMCDDDSYLSVIDTGTKLINGITLKYLVVDFLPGFGFPPYVYRDTLIEKIGFTNSYMKPFDVCGMAIDANEGGWFRCYYDDNFNLYTANYTGECDSIFLFSNVYQVEFNSILSVYPNPFKVYFEIAFTRTINNLKFSLFNVLGKQVVSIGKNQVEKLKINRNNLPSGIYFYQIVSENKIISTGKLIAE